MRTSHSAIAIAKRHLRALVNVPHASNRPAGAGSNPARFGWSPALLLLGSVCFVASAAAQATGPAAPDDQSSSDAQYGEMVHMAPLSVTASSSGYYDMTATGATRTNTPLIDIPQTVDIVTSQMWSDEKVSEWSDSFAFMSNVEVRNRFAGFGDGVSIRGFSNFTNSTAEDGILVGDQPFKRDIIGYDQLQIVKGPPSAVQGIAAGTGFFNWVLKKPETSHDFTDATFTYSSDEDGFGGGRLTLDTNYVLNSAGTMAVRLAGADSSQDEYIKFEHTAMHDLFPSYLWRISNNTELVVTTEIYDDLTPSREEGHGFADYPYKDAKLFPVLNYPGDPILALHLPMDFNISGPGCDEYEKVWYTSAFLTHEFNQHLSYRQAVNVGTSSINSAAYTAQNDEVTLINYAYIHTIDERHSETTQGDFFAKYDWDWIDSNTLLGWNYRDESTNITSWTVTPSAPFLTNGQINIVALAAAGDSANFFAGRYVTPGAPGTQTYQAEADTAAYTEQSLGFLHDKILLNASLRRDVARSRTFNELKAVQSAASDQYLTSYRYGITIKPKPWFAIYAVDSLQNNPAATYQKYTGLLVGDPRLSQFFSVFPDEQLREYGIKTSLFNGRLSLTADHWELQATGSVVNEVQTGISQGQTVSYGTETELIGSETHGFEFESEGAVTDRLSIIANYTRMYSSVQNSNDPTNPNDLIALQFDPIWSANLWVKYDFHRPRQTGFEVRAGYRAIGPFWGQVTLPTTALQAYVPQSQYTMDVGAAYSWSRYSVDFSIRNLNDSAFLLTRDIPPRSFVTSVSAHF